MFVNSRLKVTKIIGQRKAFYRQRIPESSCARKETVDIDTLVTSKKGDRKVLQSIRIASRPALETVASSVPTVLSLDNGDTIKNPYDIANTFNDYQSKLKLQKKYKILT